MKAKSSAPLDLPAKRLKELESLDEISRAMQVLDLDKILHQILDGVTKAVGFDRARLYMVDEHKHQLLLKMAVGLKKEPIGDLTLPLDRNNSVAARAVLEKKPFVVADTQSDPRVNPALVRMFNTKAFAAVPLIARNGKAKGVVAADNLYSDREIGGEMLKRLVTFANQATVAIENAEAHAQLKKFNRELKRKVAQAKVNLLRTQEQLIQSERFAALGELSAGIAHEIRNPLTSISLLVHSLERRIPDNESAQADFRIMQGEIERLNSIVTQFLEYARPSKPQLQSVSIKEILVAVRGLLAQKFHAKQLQWKEQHDESLPALKVDRFQIQQVFINLALNALGAMEHQGTGLTIRTTQENSQAIIEFADDGPGIKKEDLRKLFVPFFTTKEKGLGLGLSISQRIVASHQGTIEVKSRYGHGARFLIRLPLS